MAFEIVFGLYPEIIYDLIRGKFRARKSESTFFSANCCSERFRVEEKKIIVFGSDREDYIVSRIFLQFYSYLPRIYVYGDTDIILISAFFTFRINMCDTKENIRYIWYNISEKDIHKYNTKLLNVSNVNVSKLEKL